MKAVVVLSLVVLTACSGMPRQDQSYPPPGKPILEPWQDWRLSGRISVRTDDEGWFANLDWLQSGDRYRLAIRGALGEGVMELTGDTGVAQLRTTDGRTYADSDPDALAQQVIGMKVPVSGLRYWVHGLADPGQPENSRWDRHGLRTQLHQAGWIIQYQDYIEVDGRRLPTKIRMHNSELRIKLLIDAWERGAPRVSLDATGAGGGPGLRDVGNGAVPLSV